MQKCLSLSLVLIVSLVLPQAWAQSADDQQTSSNAQMGNSGAAPAAGQEPVPVQASQFPPLSGLDEPTLEPNVAARSFLVFGAQASEMMDSNAVNALGKNGTPILAVTHLLGMTGLQRIWERYQLALDYVGGGALYSGSQAPNSQIHELNFDARTLWRTGALTIRDSASYLPDGTYGGSFGGVAGAGGLAGEGSGLGGTNGNRFNFFGSNTFGALGLVPRVTNLAVVDVQQQLSPRSAFTLAGGYHLQHFTHATGGLLIDSRSSTGQAGYDYSLNRTNKIALIYGFQHVQFPTVSGFTYVTHVVQILYGHQITGRMDLLLGAGPQFTRLSSPAAGNTLKMSGSGRASLRYRFPRASLTMSYERYNSIAAGLFAGGSTDLARLEVARPITRRWTGSAHVGYSHNKRLLTVPAGVNANSFQSGYAGVRLSHIFSRSLDGFFLYNFNDLSLDRSYCGTQGHCNHTSTRHIVGLGLTWHPHAIRLD